MKILGIAAFYHDSAATIIDDGKIIAAAQEERFTRVKQDASFPTQAINYCLDYAGWTLDDLDAIAFYDKPLLKFERLLETYYHFAPRGFRSFVKAIPVWLREKMFLKRVLRQELLAIDPTAQKPFSFLFPEHHLSHAASTFYPSPFEEAAILTLDGVGEWATATIGLGQGKNISILKELHFPHSIGLLYSAFTYWLGFKVNSGEYKLMGLAPYGRPESEAARKYQKIILEKLIDLREDGSVGLRQKYFNYATGLSMTKDAAWEKIFDFKRRKPEEAIAQHHCDLAFAVQQVTEEIVLGMAREAKRLTKAKYLCLAGGVALNCVANGRLQAAGIFEKIFITPAAGDAGGSLGAALATQHIYFQKDRIISTEEDALHGTYLGPEYADIDVEKMARKFDAKIHKRENFEDLISEVATCLVEGKVIGWFQGRMEFGPRALGNRSILGDPRQLQMQEKVNRKIKNRESFRPFAPSVLEEDQERYFELAVPSPYMLLTSQMTKNNCPEIPNDYYSWSMQKRLAFQKSDLPAITHVDFSARIQTVTKQSNHRYWALIRQFKKLSGTGVLLNTSFNVRGEPIVCTPEDAYHCFKNTEMDILVIGNYILYKEEQAAWEKKESSSTSFPLD